MTTPLTGFMIPSLFGDEPPLADFRRLVRAAVRLDVLLLPDALAKGGLLSDMVATARYVTAQILERQPAGPVAIVGFSFGASLALEVAGQLEQAGRRISFLAILDGPFEPPDMHQPRIAASRLARCRRALIPWAVRTLERFVFVRRLMLSRATPVSPAPDRAEAMRRAVLWHLRSKALVSWSPKPCSAPGLHVFTGEYGGANRARWAELCPNLRQAEVRVIHEELLRKDALKAVASLVKQAVRER